MRHPALKFLLAMLLMLLPASALGKGGYTVVIDPGHGGHDPGAVGLRTNEKSINLDVALRLRALIEKGMPDATVTMTRSKDVFIPLQKRADIANAAKADVFISIHANSLDRKSPSYARVNGAAVYTLGLDRSDTNLSVAMRENSVMKLEDDYSTVYEGFDPSSTESYIAFEMMQHKNMDQSISLAEAVQNQLVRTAGRKNNGVRQAPFWVLVRTGMPAILVELDFISHPAQEKYMASEAGAQALATAIYNGLERYRRGSSANIITPASAPSDSSDTSDSSDSSDTSDTPSEIIYKIQFLTAASQLPAGHKNFKGLKGVESYRDGSAYKYTVGAYSSMAEATKHLPAVKKKFPDAFVIKTCDGVRIK